MRQKNAPALQAKVVNDPKKCLVGAPRIRQPTFTKNNDVMTATPTLPNPARSVQPGRRGRSFSLLRRGVLAFAAWLALPLALGAQPIPAREFADRRAEALERLADGILLLHARSTPKEMEQPGWVQDASFLYFTGLVNQPGAILALDGPRREARLFVPPPPLSFGVPVADLMLEPGPASAQAHGLTAVEPWDRLLPFLQERVREGVRRFYVDEPRRPEALGVPDGLWPVAGDKALWRRSLAAAFPVVEIASAVEVIRAMRWAKSPAEVAVLRRNAQATGAALLAGVRQIRPGATQRVAEAAVVAGCVDAGAEGPSFWPWLMSGPNTQVGRLVRAFYDYHHLNRTMQAGELVRVDVGCTGASYGGDVGRTVPVAGVFTATQRQVWNLLVAGYRAGLEAMGAGVTRTDVFDASRTAIARRRDDRAPDDLNALVDQMLDETTGVDWHLHGVGLESGEEALETLQAGTVLAFEPMFTFGPDAYYLEDMIVVTETGYQVLSTGLPYTAEEIEALMARNEERAEQ